MATYILLGSRAALARQFAKQTGKAGCLAVSRHADADATLDLQHATQDQLLRAAAALRTAAPVGSQLIVYLFATSYTYDGDIEIAKRAIQLARLLRARRIVYLSSWVVALPGGGLDFPYRRAKLECEQMIEREWDGESAVVRVANVIGSPELLQQRMLDNFGTLLPRSCMRCYIHVDEACAVLREAAAAPLEVGAEQLLFSAYGSRQTIGALLCSRTSPQPPLPTVLGASRVVLSLLPSPVRDALLYLTRLVIYVLIALLSHFHVYFKGWYLAGEFAPSSERELRSFFNHRSNKVIVVGGGAIREIFGLRTRERIVVSTRNLTQISGVAEDGTCRLQAGVTFAAALRSLRGQDRTLALLPNYSYVTLGAALAVPLHGMNAKCPTMAAVVERMSLIDLRTGRLRQLQTQAEVAQWMHLEPDTVLYLSADVRTEPITRFVLRKTTLSARRCGECAYESLSRALRARQDKRIEVRCTSPPRFCLDGIRFVAYEYDEDPGSKMEVPRNFVGKLWDFHGLIRLGRLMIDLRLIQSCEFFIDEEVFVPFMRRLDKLCFMDSRSLVGKILVRYCGVNNIPTHKQDVFCLDFAFLPTLRVLGLIEQVLSEFSQRLSCHWGKYRHPSWTPHLLQSGKVPPPSTPTVTPQTSSTSLPDVGDTPATMIDA